MKRLLTLIRQRTKIQEALNVLTQDKTLIVIAHRLSTIQHADQIIVLGKQQILEKGHITYC